MKYFVVLLLLTLGTTLHAGTVEERLDALEQKIGSFECSNFTADGSVLQGSKLYSLQKGKLVARGGSISNGYDAKVLKDNITMDLFDNEGEILEKDVHMLVVRVYIKPCSPFDGAHLIKSKFFIRY